jgi:hypothetical protein
MTIERRIAVGLGDIKTISFQCNLCSYQITMSPDEIGEIPHQCAKGHRWLPGEHQASQKQPVIKFLEALVELRTLTVNKVLGFHILLGFDEPKAS